MERWVITSSNIRSIGYDSEELILEVEFHSQSVYQYSNVPVQVFTSLKSAASHGAYFSQYIKNVYRYRKIS